MTTPTEIDLALLAAPNTLVGTITDMLIEEKDAQGAFQLTNNYLRTDRDWKITLKWQLEGPLLASTVVQLHGQWLPHAYLEGWGRAAEEVDKDNPPIDVSAAVVIPGQSPIWTYSTEFLFAAPNPVMPGTYRLAVALTFQDPNGNPAAIAGFLEHDKMLQIYRPA